MGEERRCTHAHEGLPGPSPRHAENVPVPEGAPKRRARTRTRRPSGSQTSPRAPLLHSNTAHTDTNPLAPARANEGTLKAGACARTRTQTRSRARRPAICTLARVCPFSSSDLSQSRSWFRAHCGLLLRRAYPCLRRGAARRRFAGRGAATPDPPPSPPEPGLRIPCPDSEARPPAGGCDQDRRSAQRAGVAAPPGGTALVPPFCSLIFALRAVAAVTLPFAAAMPRDPTVPRPRRSIIKNYILKFPKNSRDHEFL